VYSLVIVIVQVSRQGLALARERYALAPVATNAFFLQCTVKSLDVRIVVGPSKAGVAHSNVALPHDLLKVATVLWAIVCLDHL